MSLLPFTYSRLGAAREAWCSSLLPTLALLREQGVATDTSLVAVGEATAGESHHKYGNLI